RVSRTFLDNLRLICSVHGYPARRAARAADPDGSPRPCSTFREGGLEGLREWNPNRTVSEMAAGRDLIRESFEKQPVRTVAEACERTLATQRSGTGIGEAVRNHVVVPAAVFAQSEPDRTTVEVHHTSRPLRPLPADLRSVSSCHPRGSRRSFNHSRRKAEVADDAQVPAVRRSFTQGRVRYTPQHIGFEIPVLMIVEACVDDVRVVPRGLDVRHVHIFGLVREREALDLAPVQAT